MGRDVMCAGCRRYARACECGEKRAHQVICLHCSKSSRKNCNLNDPLCAFYRPPQAEVVRVCHQCDSYPCHCTMNDPVPYSMYETSSGEPIRVSDDLVDPANGSDAIDDTMDQFIWACGLHGDEKSKQKVQRLEERKRRGGAL